MLSAGVVPRRSSRLFRVICLLVVVLLITLQLLTTSTSYNNINLSGLFFLVVNKRHKVDGQQQQTTEVGNTNKSMSSTMEVEEVTDNWKLVDNNQILKKHFRSHRLTPQRRLPEALIIGVRKGGTRALLDALALNPRVRVARREVHFFDRSSVYERGQSVEWYRQQMPFSDTNQITIEKTPAYFVSPSTPRRIYQLNPQMKLILIVRDPVVRTISDFTQIYFTKLERNKTQIDFENQSFTPSNCIDTPLPYRNCTLNKTFKPIRNSLYSEHFVNWLKYFPLKQFLILDGDKFIRDPLGQLKLAEQFLALENVIEPSQLVFNQSKGFFCFRRKRNQSPHCLGESKGRIHVNISTEFGRELAKQFRSYNRIFFTQTNRVFPNWN